MQSAGIFLALGKRESKERPRELWEQGSKGPLKDLLVGWKAAAGSDPWPSSPRIGPASLPSPGRLPVVEREVPGASSFQLYPKFYGNPKWDQSKMEVSDGAFGKGRNSSKKYFSALIFSDAQ